jgi:hypothetical protein
MHSLNVGIRSICQVALRRKSHKQKPLHWAGAILNSDQTQLQIQRGDNLNGSIESTT